MTTRPGATLKMLAPAMLALAVALAAGLGVALDLVRDPYYAPPPPGNFTLPLPWTIVLPIAQLWTFGPALSLVAAILAWRRQRASQSPPESRSSVWKATRPLRMSKVWRAESCGFLPEPRTRVRRLRSGPSSPIW